MELPPEFAELEPFTARWCLPDSPARMRAMAAADMADLLTFYDAVLPRVEAIAGHLSQFPLDDMPPREQAILDLALTFAEVAHPVDLQWQVTEPGELFAADRIHLLGPSRAW
jgi:hypothetical protein